MPNDVNQFRIAIFNQQKIIIYTLFDQRLKYLSDFSKNLFFFCKEEVFEFAMKTLFSFYNMNKYVYEMSISLKVAFFNIYLTKINHLNLLFLLVSLK